MTLGGAVQVAAAHCPNEDFGPRSLQLDRPTYAPASRTMLFTPQCSPAPTHYFYYQVLPDTNCYSFIYPRGIEG